MSRTAYDESLARGTVRETTLTPIQESALKKATWRLVPILTLGYLFSYLDRTCIGFAGLTMKKQGMVVKVGDKLSARWALVG